MRRLIVPLVGLLFILPALACGSTAPTARVSQGASAPPSGAVPTATIPASIGKVGDTATLQNYSVTLHAKADPATGAFPAASGKRYIAYDVTITALADQVAYNGLYGKLKLADNTEVGSTIGGPDPSLKSGTLAKGESARGWLAFVVDAGAQPATLTYEIIAVGSGGRAQFDVR